MKKLSLNKKTIANLEKDFSIQKNTDAIKGGTAMQEPFKPTSFPQLSSPYYVTCLCVPNNTTSNCCDNV